MFINEACLAKTAEALRTGDLDVLDYIHMMCDRIDAVEPHIKALLPEDTRRERLLSEAKALQARFPNPATRPPLYGMLLGVKDIFRVQGFPTKAGSALPETLFEGPEAVCVARLREAGALIAGKTVTTEFAYFEPGPTRNPYNQEHTPGGSSSGSAAGVASGMYQVALGTQTIGSVIRPAAFCGIIGFKPSFDRIPTAGLIYFSRSADHVGFFTQDIEGVHRVAAILCEQWDMEQAHGKFLSPDTLPTLGVPEGKYLAQASEEGLTAFERHLERLSKVGCSIKRIPAFDDIEAINQRHRHLTAAEAAQEHAQWFAEYQALYRPRTAEIVVQGQKVAPDVLAAARAGQQTLREQLAALQAEYQIDAWVSPPAKGDAPEGIHATGDPIMNLPWTHAGVPTVTIPAGLSSRGLPLGLQFSADFMRDEQLLAWVTRIVKLL